MTPSIQKHSVSTSCIESSELPTQEHPTAQSSTGRKVYILGYGSLMSTLGRKATADDPEGFALIPVKLKHCYASWNLVNKDLKMRVLGAENAPQRYLTGVIFETTEDRLTKFDDREGRNYTRELVPLENVQCYKQEHQDLLVEGDAQVFKYCAVQKDISDNGGYLAKNPTSQDYQIFRSYLDVVLSGSHEIDEQFGLNGKFCDDYLKGMEVGGLLFLDDRETPHYSRHPLNLEKKPPVWLQSTMADYMKNTWPVLQRRADELCEIMQTRAATAHKAFKDVA